MKALAFYDTAGSVKQLVEQHDRSAAAIASRAAAEYYGAEILEAGIEDNPENYTRFFLVRRAADAQSDPEANKISIAFSVQNRPGSLVAALNELAAIGTNLTKIESRPVHGKPWEYIFYVDCQIRSSGEGSLALEAWPAIATRQGAGPLPRSRPLASLVPRLTSTAKKRKMGRAKARPVLLIPNPCSLIPAF